MSRRKQYTKNRKYNNKKIKGTMKRRYNASQLGGVTRRKYDPIKNMVATEGEVDSDDEDLNDTDDKSLSDYQTDSDDNKSNQFDSDLESDDESLPNSSIKSTDNINDSDLESDDESLPNSSIKSTDNINNSDNYDSDISSRSVDSGYDTDEPNNSNISKEYMDNFTDDNTDETSRNSNMSNKHMDNFDDLDYYKIKLDDEAEPSRIGSKEPMSDFEDETTYNNNENIDNFVVPSDNIETDVNIDSNVDSINNSIDNTDVDTKNFTIDSNSVPPDNIEKDVNIDNSVPPDNIEKDVNIDNSIPPDNIETDVNIDNNSVLSDDVNIDTKENLKNNTTNQSINNIIDLTSETSEPSPNVNIEASNIKKEEETKPIIKEEPVPVVNIETDYNLSTTFNSDNLKINFIELTDEYWNTAKNDNPKDYMKNMIDCIDEFKQNNNDQTLQMVQLTIKTTKTINGKKNADNAINGVIIIYRIEPNNIINILLMYETIVNIPYPSTPAKTLKKMLDAISEKTNVDKFEFNLINPGDNIIILLNYLNTNYNNKINTENNKYIFKDIYTNTNNVYSRYNI